ncbi:hypothetical protein BPOR_0484g00070 [Botrytis porri]|uniref:Uncharacterized protein n=1 Tax=Botrytis porri TaxID=87229 RepID=A0A4Z1KGY6_9HELO|nr:hypothetical protein BPOR_0484g00070 [Botrytis porri]
MAEKEAPSQSLVARQDAAKAHGLMGMLKNPYVFLTYLFALLGCVMSRPRSHVPSPGYGKLRDEFSTLTSSTLQGWLVASLELGAWFGAFSTDTSQIKSQENTA